MGNGGSGSVLIVDDEEIVCKRLKSSLTKEGYDVETFTDPVEAVSRMEERVFDVVVTDIRMERLDGLDVLTTVRKRWPETKIIMITGYATMEVAREALAKGAFDFIAKPFRPKDLKKLLARAFKESKKKEVSS